MMEPIRYSKQELLAWQGAGEEGGHWQSIAAAFPPELLDGASQTIPAQRRRKNVDRRQRSKLQQAPSSPETSTVLPLFVQPRESLDDEACSLDEYANHSGEEEDASDDSDVDEGSLQPLAFLVDGEPDFESGSPQDGYEYLRRVMWETAQCPKVKVAKIGDKEHTAEQTKYMPEIAPIPTCSSDLLPSKEWVHAFLKDFSALRMVISNTSAPEDCLEVLPHIRNKSVWQCLCFGQGSRSKSNDGSSEEQEDIITAQIPVDPFPVLAASHSPYLKLLLRLDENSRATLFRYHVVWLKEQRQLAYDRAMWLFALAAAVDTPLDDQTSAAFRDLLRKCAEIRARKTEVDEELYMINILITIAGEFFGQADDCCMISV